MILKNVEAPLQWDLDQADTVVSGWCFSNDTENIVAVRLKGDSWSAEGSYGLSREDVAAAYDNHEGALQSGFEIRVCLPSGKQPVILQAQDEAGDWHTLGEFEATVPLQKLRASFDTPVAAEHLAGPIRFSGWCCHPQHAISHLKLVVNDVAVECNHHLERADVAEAYGHWVDSARSGFEAKVILPPGRGKVELVATLETGQRISYQGFEHFYVRPLPLLVRLKSPFVRMFKLTGYIGRLAKERKQRLGRGPRIGELPQLVREVRTAYLRMKNGGASNDPFPPNSFTLPEPEDTYKSWQRANQWGPRSKAHLENRLQTLSKPLPTFSLVMPIYNPPLAYLDEAIQSALDQVYPHWELCLADDASTDPKVVPALQAWVEKDDRIKLRLCKKNGNISKATNAAAAQASGDFIVFFDQDDLMPPNALGEMALFLAENPALDAFYSDDDKIGRDGSRFAPQFKPDWSPELLLAYMYFSHAFGVRREIFHELGGFREGFEGSQDFDFALRLSELTSAIGHIPKVLYHWRVLPGSTAESGDEKPESLARGLKAVTEAGKRRGLRAEWAQPDWAVKGGLGIFSPVFPDEGPQVTIIIPTKNQAGILQRCIDSLKKTTYQNYDVVIIDNESDDPDTLNYLGRQPHQVMKIANPGVRFSFAYINNRAAERVESDLILFLNNDTEVIEPRWLSQMVGYTQMEGVGAVGARLHYTDGRFQHAGIVHGYFNGLAGPAFKLNPEWHNGYLSYAAVARNYAAVTAACMLTPRKLFLQLGGFDEKAFAVAYNDVDYCYRLGDAGFRSVYCAEAKLFHHEGYSRGFSDDPREISGFKRRYISKVDGYYNPNLSLDNERFEIQPRRIVEGEIAPIRTLMCSFNLNWEGAAYSQFEMTTALRDQGVIDPIVFCADDGPLRKAYEAKGIQVEVFQHPLANVFTLPDYETGIAKFAKTVKSWGVEVIYANTLETFYGIETARHLNLPCIWNPRESEPWQTYFHNWADVIAGKALSCFSYPYKIVFVADATREGFSALNTHNNFHMIHNGLNMQRLKETKGDMTREKARQELQIAEDEVALLLLGTVCSRKGQKDLVQAIGEIQPENAKRMRCFIVGDRPNLYSDEMAALREELPEALRDRIHIVPETPETARYYCAADVFVCTSRVESYPRVILEAMAYGLPCVTTPVFGITEQVIEHVNALYYQPGEIKKLAENLDRMISNDSGRLRMAENSSHVLRILNRFEDMCQAYAQVFREAWLSGGNSDEAVN